MSAWQAEQPALCPARRVNTTYEIPPRQYIPLQLKYFRLCMRFQTRQIGLLTFKTPISMSNYV